MADPESKNPKDLTQLLISWSNGDEKAWAELWPLVYEELRRRARIYMKRERPDHTLETSALVNEAYMQLVDDKPVNWQSRAHFFAVVAIIMRHILINHAKAKGAQRRGGNAPHVSLDDAVGFFKKQNIDLIALDEALVRLAEIDSQQRYIVELRYFLGFTNEEIAKILDISITQVKREWAMARTWLYRAMTERDK